MDCHLSSLKPLPIPMLTYCQLEPWEQISVKFKTNSLIFIKFAFENICNHYTDVIMGMMTSQITRLTIVYSIVYSGADQRKHRNSTSLAFVLGIHRWPVNSPHKDMAAMLFRSHSVKCSYVVTSSWDELPPRHLRVTTHLNIWERNVQHKKSSATPGSVFFSAWVSTNIVTVMITINVWIQTKSIRLFPIKYWMLRTWKRLALQKASIDIESNDGLPCVCLLMTMNDEHNISIIL